MGDSNTGTVDVKRRGILKTGGVSGLVAGAAIASSVRPAIAHQNGTFFNVRDFGAIGDGSVNDQAAIKAAINAASPPVGAEFERNFKGGVVYLPAGLYRVKSLRMRRNVTLMGEGMGTILEQEDDTNAPVITASSETEYPMIVRDLRIRGCENPRGNGQSARGILLNTTPTYGGFTVPDGQHIIDTVWVERSHAEGIKIADQCRGTLIRDCWVSKSATSSGILIDGSDSTVANTISRSHNGEGFVITSGNARMINCKAFFCRGGGFVVDGSRSNLSTCEAQDNWFDGFHILSSDAMLTGCLADSNQNAGFHVDPNGGWIGGVCMSGFIALGRPEQQSGKPWTGQDVGLLLGAGNLNESYFAGICRNNNLSQLQIDASDIGSSQLNNIVAA